MYPEEKGEFELELASVYQNHAGVDTLSIPLGFEYGISDRWQLEAEWDSFVQRFPRSRSPVRGLGDVEAGMQYSFMDIGGSTFHIAPRFSLEIPAGSVNKDLSDGFLEYEPSVILAKDFPQLHRTQVFTELGAGLLQRVNRPKDSDDTNQAPTD